MAATSLAALVLGVPTFARNTLILAGTGLTLGRWAGASAACVAQVLLVSTYWVLGVDHDSTAYWWAWLMAPAGRPSAWWAAVALAALAAASLRLVPLPGRRPPPQAHRSQATETS
ncbi:hypothetical protein [Actinomyces wuliandei]|uniref:hypothetical protein n=1 Tax=Actinomyces wuliandei TaxID=2057743 RepID=UPI000FD9CBBB|nr:hypothetical protein [Actinomyces wuliandei]